MSVTEAEEEATVLRVDRSLSMIPRSDGDDAVDVRVHSGTPVLTPYGTDMLTRRRIKPNGMIAKASYLKRWQPLLVCGFKAHATNGRRGPDAALAVARTEYVSFTDLHWHVDVTYNKTRSEKDVTREMYKVYAQIRAARSSSDSERHAEVHAAFFSDGPARSFSKDNGTRECSDRLGGHVFIPSGMIDGIISSHFAVSGSASNASDLGTRETMPSLIILAVHEVDGHAVRETAACGAKEGKIGAMKVSDTDFVAQFELAEPEKLLSSAPASTVFVHAPVAYTPLAGAKAMLARVVYAAAFSLAGGDHSGAAHDVQLAERIVALQLDGGFESLLDRADATVYDALAGVLALAEASPSAAVAVGLNLIAFATSRSTDSDSSHSTVTSRDPDSPRSRSAVTRAFVDALRRAKWQHIRSSLTILAGQKETRVCLEDALILLTSPYQILLAPEAVVKLGAATALRRPVPLEPFAGYKPIKELMISDTVHSQPANVTVKSKRFNPAGVNDARKSSAPIHGPSVFVFADTGLAVFAESSATQGNVDEARASADDGSVAALLPYSHESVAVHAARMLWDATCNHRAYFLVRSPTASAASESKTGAFAIDPITVPMLREAVKSNALDDFRKQFAMDTALATLVVNEIDVFKLRADLEKAFEADRATLARRGERAPGSRGGPRRDLAAVRERQRRILLALTTLVNVSEAHRASSQISEHDARVIRAAFHDLRFAMLLSELAPLSNAPHHELLREKTAKATADKHKADDLLMRGILDDDSLSNSEKLAMFFKFKARRIAAPTSSGVPRAGLVGMTSTDIAIALATEADIFSRWCIRRNIYRVLFDQLDLIITATIAGRVRELLLSTPADAQATCLQDLGSALVSVVTATNSYSPVCALIGTIVRLDAAPGSDARRCGDAGDEAANAVATKATMDMRKILAPFATCIASTATLDEIGASVAAMFVANATTLIHGSTADVASVFAKTSKDNDTLTMIGEATRKSVSGEKTVDCDLVAERSGSKQKAWLRNLLVHLCGNDCADVVEQVVTKDDDGDDGDDDERDDDDNRKVWAVGRARAGLARLASAFAAATAAPDRAAGATDVDLAPLKLARNRNVLAAARVPAERLHHFPLLCEYIGARLGPRVSSDTGSPSEPWPFRHVRVLPKGVVEKINSSQFAVGTASDSAQANRAPFSFLHSVLLSPSFAVDANGAVQWSFEGAKDVSLIFNGIDGGEHVVGLDDEFAAATPARTFVRFTGHKSNTAHGGPDMTVTAIDPSLDHGDGDLNFNVASHELFCAAAAFGWSEDLPAVNDESNRHDVPDQVKDESVAEMDTSEETEPPDLSSFAVEGPRPKKARVGDSGGQPQLRSNLNEPLDDVVQAGEQERLEAVERQLRIDADKRRREELRANERRGRAEAFRLSAKMRDEGNEGILELSRDQVSIVEKLRTTREALRAHARTRREAQRAVYKSAVDEHSRWRSEKLQQLYDANNIANASDAQRVPELHLAIVSAIVSAIVNREAKQIGIHAHVVASWAESSIHALVRDSRRRKQHRAQLLANEDVFLDSATNRIIELQQTTRNRVAPVDFQVLRHVLTCMRTGKLHFDKKDDGTVVVDLSSLDHKFATRVRTDFAFPSPAVSKKESTICPACEQLQLPHRLCVPIWMPDGPTDANSGAPASEAPASASEARAGAPVTWYRASSRVVRTVLLCDCTGPAESASTDSSLVAKTAARSADHITTCVLNHSARTSENSGPPHAAVERADGTESGTTTDEANAATQQTLAPTDPINPMPFHIGHEFGLLPVYLKRVMHARRDVKLHRASKVQRFERDLQRAEHPGGDRPTGG